MSIVSPPPFQGQVRLLIHAALCTERRPSSLFLFVPRSYSAGCAVAVAVPPDGAAACQLCLFLSLSLSQSWDLLFIYLFAREGARAHVHRARPSVSVSVSFSLKWGKIIKKKSCRDTDILAQFGARLRATIWKRVKSGRASGGFIFKGCTVISAASLTAGPLAKQWRTQERPV